MKQIDKLNFSDRMVLMNTISILGYNLFASYITRAYMEQFTMLYISINQFVGYLAGYLTNKLMDNKKIKKFLFNNFSAINVGLTVIDVISVTLFAVTRNFVTVFIMGLFAPLLGNLISLSLADILNANINGNERSSYTRKLGARENICYAIVNVFCIVFSAIVVKDKQIGYGLIVFICLFMLVVETFVTWYAIVYVYRPNVERVYKMWEEENSHIE